MKVLIYILVHLDEDEETITTQLATCAAWAEAKGHEIAGVVTTGEFAKQDVGPHRVLLKAVESRRYEAVVASTLSRFNRDDRRFKVVQDSASVEGVRLFTAEPDEEIVDPLSRLLAGIRLRDDVVVPVDIVDRHLFG